MFDSRRRAIVTGLWLGGFLVAYGWVFDRLRLPPSSALSWVFYLAPPIAALILRRRLLPFPAPSRAGYLALAAAVGATLYVVFVWLLHRFDPTFFDLIVKDREATLLRAGASQAELAAKTAQVRKVLTPGLFALSVAASFGTISVLVSALIGLVPAKQPTTSPFRRAEPVR